MPRKTEAETFDELIIKGTRCPKKKTFRQIEPKKVFTYFASKICKFANGGGYIPCSDEYDGKKVYVVVLTEKAR